MRFTEGTEQIDPESQTRRTRQARWHKMRARGPKSVLDGCSLIPKVGACQRGMHGKYHGFVGASLLATRAPNVASMLAPTFLIQAEASFEISDPMRMKHKIESVSFSGNQLKLRVDGNEYRIVLSLVSDKLARASKAERATYRVSPSGFGIHWPLLDEDLTIDGLVRAGSSNAPLKRAG